MFQGVQVEAGAPVPEVTRLITIRDHRSVFTQHGKLQTNKLDVYGRHNIYELYDEKREQHSHVCFTI